MVVEAIVAVGIGKQEHFSGAGLLAGLEIALQQLFSDALAAHLRVYYEEDHLAIKRLRALVDQGAERRLGSFIFRNGRPFRGGGKGKAQGMVTIDQPMRQLGQPPFWPDFGAEQPTQMPIYDGYLIVVLVH